MGSSYFALIIGLGMMLVRPLTAQTLTFVHHYSSSFPMADVTGDTLDSTGVYIAGGLRKAQFSPNFNLDAYVRKTDTNGQELWVRQLGGAATIAGIAAASGGVYIAGETGWNIDEQVYYSLPGQTPLGLTDAFIRRYDANGNELWTRQFGTANFDYIYGTVADSTGVYVVGNLGVVSPQTFPSGQPFLTKYDPSGNELWTTNLEVADARLIASDGTAIYVFARMNWANNTYQPFLSKYDSSGSPMWTQLTPGIFPSALVSNSTGVFLGVGSSLYRYDLNGNLMWTLKGANGGPLALDQTGLYGLGAYNAPGQCPSGEGDTVIARYDLDGNQVWLRQFEADGAGTAFAADSSGVYVAGPGAGTFLARLEGALATPVAGKPQIRNECVLNAADFIGGGVTPGEMVTILGSGMGPAQPTSQTAPVGGLLPTALAGTRVSFNGVATPLIYVSDGQINGVAPAALSGATVDVQVEYNAVASSTLTLPVRGARFAIFEDRSGRIVLNADGSRNSQSNPAARGSVITAYGTGAAITNPSIADGQILDAAAAASLAATTKARFIIVDPACNQTEEDSPAAVQGVAGSVYGIFQVSMTVPADLSLDYPPEVYLDLGVGLGLVWID